MTEISGNTTETIKTFPAEWKNAILNNDKSGLTGDQYHEMENTVFYAGVFRSKCIAVGEAYMGEFEAVQRPVADFTFVSNTETPETPNKLTEAQAIKLAARIYTLSKFIDSDMDIRAGLNDKEEEVRGYALDAALSELVSLGFDYTTLHSIGDCIKAVQESHGVKLD